MTSSLPKTLSCQNSPEKSYTEEKAKHTPSDCSGFTCCSFDASKDECGYHRGEDCIKKLREDFKDQVMKIINYERKEMIPLTDKETEFYEKQKVCHICRKEFSTDKNNKNKFKPYHKVRDHCHYTGKFRGGDHNICNLRYKTPKEIPGEMLRRKYREIHYYFFSTN